MNYLITGGTGLVGKRLTEILLENGHTVSILSRSKRKNSRVKYFQWDLKNETIETEALVGVDCLIHLAGAGIADKKWTKKRKQEIIESRVEPLKFLAEKFNEIGNPPKVIVSASAIGIYGFDTGDKLLTEVHESGQDYISNVVVLWERAVEEFAEQTHARQVKLRIGIVLDKNGGALPHLALPVKLGVGSPIGDGNQWMSWIHIEDLCQLFYTASVSESFKDSYNAVSPNPAQNKEIVKHLGEVLHRPIWAPNVPKWVLKTLLQERAQLVLGGNKVSSVKVEAAGYQFIYSDLKDALKEIYTTK